VKIHAELPLQRRRREVEKLVKLVSLLRAALREYGGHTDDCVGPDGRYAPSKRCYCGFTDASKIGRKP
jgi:hypothetical protein